MTASQSLVLSWANLRGIRARAVSSLVAMLGFAGVTTMIVVLLSGREAIRAMYDLAGRDDVAIVRGGLSTWETSGFLPLPLVLEIERMPGIARDARGPVISREFAGGGPARLPSREPGTIGRTAGVRGVTPAAFGVRQHFHIVSGRNFASGRHEVIVGRTLADAFGVSVGDEVRINRTNLSVVGVFSSGGSSAEMEVWADKAVLESIVTRSAATSVTGKFEITSSLWVRLAGPDGLKQLQDAIAASTTPAMKLTRVRAETERQFFSSQSKGLLSRATQAALAVGLIMGIGALFGAINTMYAAVGQRSREIATLRALGFLSLPVAVSVMTEALALSLAGGLVGASLAALAVRNLSFIAFNDGASSYLALHFLPTSGVLAIAIGYVLVLGVTSSILPCMRALRGSIPLGLFAR
jgi:putative ABC transport system permease protein